MPDLSIAKLLNTVNQSFPERWFLAGLILLGLTLGLTSINRGLQSDDYLHRAMLGTLQETQERPLANRLDNFDSIHQLFVFFDPQNKTSSLPWWSNPDLKIKFWRPLSAFTHYLDYQLWPNNIKAMHAHSILWYVLLVLLCYAFFKQLMGTLAAQWAALIFCLDFSHFANLSWLANRNSLIAACLVLTSALFFIKAYRCNHKSYFFFSVCAYALALLSAEASILAPFIAASYFYFFKDHKHSGLRNKTLTLVFSAYFLIALGFLLAYQYPGYGISNSGLYISPVENPFLALQALLAKIPVFYFGQLFVLEGFYNVFSLPLQLITSFLCFVFLLLFFYFTKAFFKQESLLFYLANSLVFLLPASLFALTDMRLNLLSSVFSAGLLGICLSFSWQYFFVEKNNSTVKYQFLFIFILLAHLVINGSQWLYTAYQGNAADKADFSELSAIHESYPGKTIFIFNHPKPLDFFYFDFYLKSMGHNSADMHVLNSSFNDFRLEVLDQQSLKISADTGFVFKASDFEENLSVSNTYANAALASVFISPQQVLEAGDSFSNEYFFAEIIQVAETKNKKQLAKEITFTFTRGFYEEAAVFLIWRAKEKHYQEINIIDLLQTQQVLIINNQAFCRPGFSPKSGNK